MTVGSRRNLSRIVSAALVAGLITLSGGVAWRAGAQSAGLPRQLTDREFWDLIVTLSEPDGFFEDENYVSNEQGYQRSMRQRRLCRSSAVHLNRVPVSTRLAIEHLEGLLSQSG